MKYRVFALMGMLAIAAGSLIQAQDYDDIYYDASKSTTGETKSSKSTKAMTPTRTVAVYGEVPERYSVTAGSNYRVERDDDEYNRRGAYDPDSLAYEVDINGDTIFEEAFANTRRIERFYNPDIVILSDDDELVELYYDESPTINLIVGSDWGYGSYYSPYYSWGYGSYYYPWYTGWYDPWYIGYGWYSPWRWHSPWYYGSWHWGWHYSPWYRTGWGWDYAWHPGWGGRHWNDWTGTTSVHPSRPGYGRPAGVNLGGSRVGLATNRNGRSRVGADAGNRNGISPRGGDGNRPSGVGSSTSRSRGGYATGRGGGNMGSRGSSGVTGRSGVSRSSSGGSRSYSGSSSGGSRSYSGGSSSGGSRSYSGGSSSGGSRSSGGSYSGGGSRSGGSSGGGSHGGSSGGGSGSRRH